MFYEIKFVDPPFTIQLSEKIMLTFKLNKFRLVKLIFFFKRVGKVKISQEKNLKSLGSRTTRVIHLHF